MVGRATRARLATSKSVFGVAKADAADTDPLEVLVAGEVVDTSIATGLAAGAGAGTSHIIATDITQATAADQCRMIRVLRPNGSEHVCGTVDENGNLAVQPRASTDTSPQHVFNVCSYGAKGDGIADDAPAFRAILDSLALSTSDLAGVPPRSLQALLRVGVSRSRREAAA